MKKLIELNNHTLRTGRTRSKFMPGGIWDSAQGMNPYLENDTYRGTIAVTATPTDLTGSVIVDNPIAYTKNERNSTYNLYMMGDAGHFYSLNTAGTIVTDLRSGTPISGPANGMAVFKPRAAFSPTLLYATNASIGTWDMSGVYPTGWTDNFYTLATTPTKHRPMHPFFDRVYYGNLNYVGQFADDGTATIAHTAQVLNVDGYETVTALSDDGRYLMIATARTVDENYNGASRVRILFWDTNKNSWDWEVSIPNEFSIRGFKRIGDVNYAVGKRGLYAVAFGVAPKLVYTFDSDETIAFDGSNYGHVQSIAPWGDGVIFGKLGTAFSSFLPGTDRIVYNPLQGFTGDIGIIIPDYIENKVFVGTRSAKFYSYNMTLAGSTTASFVTRFIDLEGFYHVQRLDLTLPNGPSGTISILVSGTNTLNTTPSIIVNETKYPGQRHISIPLNQNITTPHVKISVLLSAGTPAISAMSLWGEPAT
jgi:hypothetical protein